MENIEKKEKTIDDLMDFLKDALKSNTELLSKLNKNVEISNQHLHRIDFNTLNVSKNTKTQEPFRFDADDRF